MAAKDSLTSDQLRKLLCYDPQTGRFVRIIRAAANAPAGSIAGHVSANGYTRIDLLRSKYLAHRLAWLYVYGEWPAGQIDHIDRDPSNNRIANLRVVTNAQNHQNRNGNKRNTSGFRGVGKRADGKWTAYIKLNFKRRFVGSFATFDEACAARINAEQTLFTHAPVEQTMRIQTSSRPK